MKKEQIKNIAIILLVVVIIVLILYMILNKKTIIKYKNFDDELIQINNKSTLKATSNLINNNRLIIFLKTDKDVSCTGKVNVEFYNNENKKIYENNPEYFVSRNSGAIIETPLPNLKDNYAGTIKITVEKEDIVDDQSILKPSELTYTMTKTIDENKYTNITLNFINKNNTSLEYFSGTIVAFKNNKIVDFNNFYQDKLINSNFTINTNLSNEVDANGVKELEYDKIEVYYYASKNV